MANLSFAGSATTGLKGVHSKCLCTKLSGRRYVYRTKRHRRAQISKHGVCSAGISMTMRGGRGERYEDDGGRVVPVPLFIHGTSDESVKGVYGVLDEHRELVYVGMSRDVAASLEAHASSHRDEVCYVKVMTFALPMVREMKRVVDLWILENETTPVGNIERWYEVDQELSKQASALSIIELANDDKSNGESNKKDDANKSLNAGSSMPRIVSPFEKDPLRDDDVVNVATPMQQLTKSKVDVALEAVRPYLLADGGNITVERVDAEEGVIEVRLEGACGSCESAATTMRMGVEKVLHRHFGSQLQRVVAINNPQPHFSDDVLSVELCEIALDSIRDVLHGLGAEVSVIEVDEDEVIMSYRGPQNLKFGIEQTLREKVPDVAVVTFE